MECLRSELEKAKLASRRRPINIEVEECRKFITRPEKRIIDLDEEWTREMASLAQARERLQRLEAEQVSDPVAPPQVDGHGRGARRSSARHSKCQAVGPRGHSIPAMATLVPRELDWMQDRHYLQDAMIEGDGQRSESWRSHRRWQKGQSAGVMSKDRRGVHEFRGCRTGKFQWRQAAQSLRIARRPGVPLRCPGCGVLDWE